MTPTINLQVKVPACDSGKRLDQIAADLFPNYSRARLQAWIKSGCLLVDERAGKPNMKLAGGETLDLKATIEVSDQWQPEDIPLDIVFEDDDIIVVNKPRNLVVHPAAGNWSGTLLNGLLFRYPELAEVPRAGIVHRLDKDTTGLMVVARNVISQLALVEQLQERTVSRVYWAIVRGELKGSGTIDEPLGRHASQRTKMAISAKGKEAITHYQVLTKFDDFTLVKLKLQTGRTHQIRVHMAHLGHALLGDQVYGSGKSFKGIAPEVAAFDRQALHAKSLGLIHPISGEECEWSVPLPEDISELLEILGE